MAQQDLEGRAAREEVAAGQQVVADGPERVEVRGRPRRRRLPGELRRHVERRAREHRLVAQLGVLGVGATVASLAGIGGASIRTAAVGDWVGEVVGNGVGLAVGLAVGAAVPAVHVASAVLFAKSVKYSPAGQVVFLAEHAVALFVSVLKWVEAHAVHVASTVCTFDSVKYWPAGHVVLFGVHEVTALVPDLK